MPVLGNVNGLAIMPGNELVDVDELRKQADKLPRTMDGKLFWIGDTVYTPNPDRSYFGDDDILELTVETVGAPLNFDSYNGTWNVIAGDHEGGNLDYYSTREACPNVEA